MLLRFLRLFRAYRQLEFALAESVKSYEKQSGVYGEKSRLEIELASADSDLEAARNRNAELEQENLRLQDRLEFAQQDRNRVWDSFQEALAGERLSYQMQINQTWQKQSGVTPFPDAPHLPETQVASPTKLGPVGRGGVRLASEIVENATRGYWQGKNLHAERNGVVHEQAG